MNREHERHRVFAKAMVGLRRQRLLLAAALLFSAWADAAGLSPAQSVAPTHAAPQYLLVYALDGKKFLFAGQTYNHVSIAPALAAADTAGVVHVIVMRDAGQGFTVGDLLAVVPALSNAKSCLFFQSASGAIKTISMNGKDGKAVDQSFCPKPEDVATNIGPYTPAPAASLH